MVDSNKDVDSDPKNKVDLGDVYCGGSDNNDEGGLGFIVGVDTNGGDNGNYGDGGSKVDCGDDLDGDGVDEDGCVESNIGNKLW